MIIKNFIFIVYINILRKRKLSKNNKELINIGKNVE